MTWGGQKRGERVRVFGKPHLDIYSQSDGKFVAEIRGLDLFDR